MINIIGIDKQLLKTIEFNNNLTISDIKKKILENQKNINKILLFHAGHNLDNMKTVKEYNIKNNDNIFYIFKGKTIKIIIDLSLYTQDETYIILVVEDDILNIKIKEAIQLYYKNLINIKQIDLIYNNIKLENYKCIKEYIKQNNCVIKFILNI